VRKIYFISDFFAIDHPGGAELVDDQLVNYLKHKGHIVEKIRSFDSDKIKETFLEDACYIVSNFVGMTEEIKKGMQSKRYSIYEHDHKYLVTRDPSNFVDFKAPESAIINRDFYRWSQNIFCQSKKHKEVVESNLKLLNIVNLGCTLWSDKEISSLERVAGTTKTKNTAILKSSIPTKGHREAEEYCKENNPDFESIGNLPYDEFLTELAKFENLVFLPSVLESFSRLAVEARILGCKLITNQNIGCTSEEWFRENKGTSLLEIVKSRQLGILEKIEKSITSEDCHQVPPIDHGITVILNSYRRPYNLELQIKAIREQSKVPAEIWLWVNKHEDNVDFDYESLGIDKIFRNDYNWKFYGRFAAALLADTEFVAIFDDDTIPGNNWFDNCIKTMKSNEGILGTAGVTLNDSIYMHHNRCGWPSHNEETTRVDLVGHAWFFKREWLKYLWMEKPTTWDNGEDIQFSYLAQKYGNVQTYCPPHPPNDKSQHGSILGNELGIDNKATSTNNEISHEQFFSERDTCVQTAIKGGWRTVKGIAL
jgi:hypothetical protein